MRARRVRHRVGGDPFYVEGRRPQAADDGFTLVEVIVSFVLFMILAATAGLALTSAVGTSASNEARVVAANLAARQIETIAGQSADRIVDGAAARQTLVVGGRTYYLDQTSTLATEGGSGSACSGASGPASYKRVTVTVTWDRMLGIAPVHSDTIKALGVLGLTGSRGVLAVAVQDDVGKGVSGVPVSVATMSSVTDADGCAVFAGLPPGTTYTATAQNTGYVGRNSESSLVSGYQSVTAGQVTKVPALLYNRAASALLTIPAPSGYPAPSGLNVTLSGSLLTGTYKTFPPCTTVGSANCNDNLGSGQVRVSQLFPLTSGYQAWGGACATARTVTTPSIMTGPGQESTGAVPSLGGVAVSVQGSTVAANSYTVVAKNVDCPAETYPLQGTLGLSGSSVLQIALPAGNWNLQATAGSTRTGSRLVTVTSGQVANGGAAVAVTVP